MLRRLKYCLELSETDGAIFGPEFVGRIEELLMGIDEKRILFYVGGDCPTFAEDYDKLASNFVLHFHLKSGNEGFR